MFVSAGGGGKRIGSNKQNQQQQQQQPQLQPHQHPSHPQTHQLLQQHQVSQQQQQIQNNTLLHNHNKQTASQSAANSHPLSHTLTQQQQQQQQTVIVQHQQKPPPPPTQSSHQSQYPHHKIPIIVSYQLGNVHAPTSATGQHRPVQAAVGAASQISPSSPSLVCNSNDIISSNRPTAVSNSSTLSHYMPQTTNSHLMTPAYHLQMQQNTPLMVAGSPFNNMAATTAGNGANQLNNTSAGAAFYPTQTQQPQTSPAQSPHQPLLMNSQHTLQYFPNSSVPIHHPQQQMRSVFSMMTQTRHQYIIQGCFPLSHHHPTLQPQTLTNAPSQYPAAAQGLATVAANSASSVSTQMQTVTQRNTVVGAHATYMPAQFCAPSMPLVTTPTSLSIPSAGMVDTTTTSTLSSVERKPIARISHAVKIINPETNEEVIADSKKKNYMKEQNTVVPTKPIEISSEQQQLVVEDIQSQQQEENLNTEIVCENVCVQTEDENSLTASIASDCSEIMTPTQSQPTAETDKNDDNDEEEAQEPTNATDEPTDDTDKGQQLDEIDSASFTNKSYQKDEDEIPLNCVINENIVQSETAEKELSEEEFKNVPDINNATIVAFSNPPSSSGTDSLKICIYGDPNDTDADANEHELDNDELDVVEHSKEMECEKLTAYLDEENSCTPNKLNDDEFNQNNETTATAFVSKQSRNNSKKGAKRSANKKNKKKSKQQQQQQQQQQKSSDTNNQLSKISSAITSNNNNNNTITSVTDNEKTLATSINNKIQSEQFLEQTKKSSNTTTSARDSNRIEKQVSSAKSLDTKANSKKNMHNKNRSNAIAAVGADAQKEKNFIRYSLDELKALAKVEESNKVPTVRCQKGGCISQLFVARQQQHFHHSHSFTGSNNQNLPQHHHLNAAASKTPLIRINLSLKEEIHLSRSKNAWQPKTLQPSSKQKHNDNSGNSSTEEELKKVRGILNKLTLDNFQVLVKSMKDICLNTKESIEKVMVLIFEKTVSEPNFAPIYAKFCHVLFQEIKPESKKLFNLLLIHRLQMEFENNVNNPNAKDSTLQHIIDKLKDTKDPKEILELTNEYDVEEYKFRRRAWGTVRFIGEMYKLNCLTGDRALLCVESLLDNGNEEKLEYLCKLLTTVGPQLDGNGSQTRLNNIFLKIQNIIREAKSSSSSGTAKQKLKISSRVRFMLEDIIDLRSRNWDLKPNSNTILPPPTSSSSSAGMRTSQQQHKNNNFPTNSSNINNNNFDRGNNQRAGGYGNNNHRQGRNNMHINERMKENSGHFAQKSIDIKKLNFSRGVDESSLTNTKLGNSSIYMWRTEAQQSGRNTPTSTDASTQKSNYQTQSKCQSASPPYDEAKSQGFYMEDIRTILESCSPKDSKKLLNYLIEEYLDSKRWQDEVFKTWQKTEKNQQICLIYYILKEYLQSTNAKRNACSNIFIYLLRCNDGVFKKKTFALAYEAFIEDIPDLMTDAPYLWSYIFEFLGPILHERLLEFGDIWCNTWLNNRKYTEPFVKALVLYFTTEYGANYMRDLWHKLGLEQLFATDSQHWQQFVVANNFQFIYDRNVKPNLKVTPSSATSVEQKVQRLEILLNSADNSNLALDYINTNVNINSKFLKHLIPFICCDYAIQKSMSNKDNSSSTCSSSNDGGGSNVVTPQLDIHLFRSKCLPLLRLCLDANEDYEIVCLDTIVSAMQYEYDVYRANNLICNIFNLLYDSELIAKESFEKWYRQWQQQQQKCSNDDDDTKESAMLLQAFMQKIL